jgi:hypothetical protein
VHGAPKNVGSADNAKLTKGGYNGRRRKRLVQAFAL